MRLLMMNMLLRNMLMMLMGVSAAHLSTGTTVPTATATAAATAAIPDLPWGDINVLVVTDEHSWVGGHGNEDAESADYGHVLSFVTRIRQYQYALDHPAAAAAAAATSNTTDATAATDTAIDATTDVWWVMNGDWIDGTGLATNGDPSYLIPILQHMPFDAIAVGNHELYHASVVQAMTRPAGLIDWFAPRYLSSNVHLVVDNTDDNINININDNKISSRRPLGVHAHILRGRRHNVLTMGFLYDMTGYADTVVTVQAVADAVQEDWFRDTVLATDEYHAILILAHMDVRDPLVTVLLEAIRTLLGGKDGSNNGNDANGKYIHMPVQFITGHTHKRDYQVLDATSTSMEAGRYLDTIGFVSFPCLQTVLDQVRRNEETAAAAAVVLNSTTGTTTTTAIDTTTAESMATTNTGSNVTLNPTMVDTIPTTATTTALPLPELFQHKFIDATVPQFMQILGLSHIDQFNTRKGLELSDFIRRVEIELGLEKVIGCVAHPYYWNGTLDGPDSLWGLFRHSVVPYAFATRPLTHDDDDDDTIPVAVLLPTGSWRYDLPTAGVLSVGDVIAVSPYNNTLYSYSRVPSAVIRALETYLNVQQQQPQASWWPDYVVSTTDATHHHVIPPDEDTERLYTLIINGFGLNGTDQALREVLSTNFSHVHIDMAVEMPGVTTTSIWMDYFVHNSETCFKGQKHYKPDQSPTNRAHHGTGGNNSSMTDSTRLVWMGACLVVTLILGGIVVYQKSVVFQQRVQARDFAILSAAQEYNDYHDDDDDDDDGSDNSYLDDASDAIVEDEGKFV